LFFLWLTEPALKRWAQLLSPLPGSAFRFSPCSEPEDVTT
jgi:hypothetical protein